jgi:hypothetical protein
MAVAAVNCPVTATEVWNTAASSTKSGPNISQTVIDRKIAEKPLPQEKQVTQKGVMSISSIIRG